MVDEKHVYEVTENAPIPTYEEATSSRTHARLGPQEVSDDAERQGLLGSDLPRESISRRRNGYYQPPSVQSVHSSDDEGSDPGSPVDDREDVALRAEMEEMDILDPESAEDERARRNRLRGRFSKRFSQITDRLSSFHLPRIPWPSFGFGWLKDRMPSVSEEYRPGWAIILRLAVLILIISLMYLLIVSNIMPMGSGNFGQPFDNEWVRRQAQAGVQAGRIQENLKYISSFDHVGGSEGSFYIGQWIEGKFKESHMDSLSSDEYFVYLNYPKKGGRRVAIVEPPELAWEAGLEEDSVYNPPQPQTPAFHGLSASGDVTGPLIYANYGHKDDFKWLKDNGIDVKGAVVLMRYYGTQPDRGMKVKAAQDAGAAGALIYSDPQEDGFKKGSVWPHGKWRPDDSVQRGSVALTSWIVGDVLTPGVPSTKDAKRMPKDKNPALPTIPSLPLSWRDAQKLLKSLSNIGTHLPADWYGTAPDWNSGNSSHSPKVNLQNHQDEVEKQPITNVFGSFIGMEEKAKKIIVGNHRDSWCFGAADPGSGTAVMLEVARVLGDLRMQGWRPQRTIEFASWDASEFNLIGSTEHVEANIDDLRANAVAYINVDSGVTGSKLRANGSPLFKHAWLRAIERVTNPQNVTLKELWEKENSQIGGLGVGSDYVAFQDMAGCSSFDFGFKGELHADMLGSCHETYEWVEKFVDPGFEYHGLLAQVWVLLILELAQEPILPFKLDDYAEALQSEALILIDWAKQRSKGGALSTSKGGAQSKSTGGEGGEYDYKMFQPLLNAVDLFVEKASTFHKWDDYWYNQIYGTGGFETPSLTLKRLRHNGRMTGFETGLLDLPVDDKDKGPHGIPGRDQYKHVIFGPDAFGNANGDGAAIFPFVRDAIENGEWELAKLQVQKTADILRRAVESLSA